MSLNRLILLVLFGGFLWGSHQTHLNLVEKVPLDNEVFDVGYFPPSEVFQAISLGHDTLMADLIWLQVIQYYGETAESKRGSPYLYRFFDAITTLDPDFIHAYVFASFVMADENKTQKAQAKALLKKGMALNPDDWNIPYQLGFMNYLYYKDYEEAAENFEVASRKPDAPTDYLQRLAANLLTKADPKKNCQTAKNLWGNAIKTAINKDTKLRSERHYIELSMLCDLLDLREKIQVFQSRQNQLREKIKLENEVLLKAAKKGQKPKLKPLPTSQTAPSSLQDLVNVGLLPRIPKDFYGRDYVYSSLNGSVKVKPLDWNKTYELKESDIAS